jgi:hypothetical protein
VRSGESARAGGGRQTFVKDGSKIFLEKKFLFGVVFIRTLLRSTPYLKNKMDIKRPPSTPIREVSRSDRLPASDGTGN